MDFNQIKNAITIFPDFPQPGVSFKDISPLLANPEYFSFIIDAMAEAVERMHASKIVAIDARGFLFGSAVAYKLGLSLVICRKKGKLPGELISATYNYEYSSTEISIQKNKLGKSDSVVIIDDVLATGNTALATYNIVKQFSGVTGFISLIELDELHGRNHIKEHTQLKDSEIISFIHY